MELNPHDLLRIKNVFSVISNSPKPLWVKKSLTRAPYVVVRRSPIEKGKIPVGIRGNNRNERFAAFIFPDSVTEIITPERLAKQKMWRKSPRYNELKILQSLDNIDEIFRSYEFSWGPTGSAAFEIVSGIPTVNDTSDLDIIIRASNPISVEVAKKIADELADLPIRVDAQIETSIGAISLVEYSSGHKQILLKSKYGPQLITNPWMRS